MNELNVNSLKLEGQLCKYTNVMRGYQFRYFVVDATQGKLHYFMSEDMKHQRPRSSINLYGAVISPSDEDSTTFTVYTSENEMFKLRAQDARERQHWVNVLRLVSQSAAMEPLAEYPTPQKLQQTIQNGHSKSTNDLKRVRTKSERMINIQLIHEVLNVVHSSEQELIKQINNFPMVSSNGIARLDKDMLLLKATTEACVNSLCECCHVFNVKHKKRHSYAFSSSNDHHNLSIKSPQLLNDSLNQSSNNLELSQKSIQNLNSTNNNNNLSSINSATSSSTNNLTLNSNNNNNSSATSTSTINTATISNTFLSHTVININHDDEISDDESNGDNQQTNECKLNEYNQVFDDNKSLILHVLSNLKLGMDLTKVTLPTFVLDKRSALELFADCMAHPDLFLKIPNEKTPEERIINVLVWYLTSFHPIRKGSFTKKPYNPLIGETFHCSWKVPSSDVNNTDAPNTQQQQTLTTQSPSLLLTYDAEQVSHHPPITAFYMECEEKKIKLNASIYTESKFLGMSIGVTLIGKLMIKLGQYNNEEYHITLPGCYARSILTHPWVELGDKVTITCPQTGCSVSIVFHVKPFYGGYSNQVSAEVKNKNEEIICKVQGTWNGTLEYQFVNPPKESKTVDINSLKVIRKRVRPLEMQSQMESRRLWQNVTNSLSKNDIESATNYKNELETQQRENIKEIKEKNNEYKAKYFIKNKDNDEWLHQNWII